MNKVFFASVSIVATAAAPLMAQTPQNSAQVDVRVGKLEKEMKAVQRVVFPQGAPVQPDLTTSSTPTAAAGAAATTPISDLTTRVDTLERQLATMTGASEQAGFKIKQLEDALSKVQTRLTALEGGASAAGAAATGGPASSIAVLPASTKPSGAAARPTSSATGAPKPVATINATAKADPARKAAVAAIEMPTSGDAIEDDYTYGFRLYTAKFYPEAQAKLKDFTAKYPTTQRRWSYAQNLLGRAYLDESKPALASVAFYDNYQKAPRGERAGESLTWLGQALIKLKKNTDACKVFDELNEVFGTKLTPDQKARAAKGRVDAKCAA